MRIIAGQHRGTALTPVGKGDATAHLRPTTDRVRESLFNVLQGGRFGDPITGARVLDLFAGTGALGLEALSRGAAHVTFVDNGKAALKLIRANIAKLRRADDCTILAQAAAQLPQTRDPAHLVFLDPPYGQSMGQPALDAARKAGWLAPGALIVWEEAQPQMAPVGYDMLDQRRYGDTHVAFLKAPSVE